MNRELFSRQSNNNSAPAREMLGAYERRLLFLKLRRKDLVIYELPGLFRIASRNPADEEPLAAAFNCKLSVANGKFSRYPRLVVRNAARGVFSARHQGRGSRVGWRKATIINAALGSRK